MMMPLARRLLGAACALLLTATITPTADAFFYSPFGYSWGYSPYTTYYGGYGGYYGGYATGYRGYSYALYAPSYVSYGSSYCGSSCGTGCSPCGSSCGSSCNPCGVSYGGYSCGSCGLSSCYGSCGLSSCYSGCGLTGCSGGCGLTGCGIASNCTSSGDCGTGLNPPVGETKPQNEPYSGEETPSTYKNEPASSGNSPDNFSTPRPSGRSNAPAAGSGNSGTQEEFPGDDGIFPSNDGGSEFGRGAYKPVGEEPIKQRSEHAPTPAESTEGQEPADMEPTDDEEGSEESETQDAEVRPADIKTRLASSISAKRSRAHYSVRFHAPRVARLDVKPSSKWVPIESDTKLAATK
ncbi:MAG: heterocycloanthracin/sonorensin family bacteriocin [Planctomycetaceae bacterium]